jgi:hypothetical protein
MDVHVRAHVFVRVHDSDFDAFFAQNRLRDFFARRVPSVYHDMIIDI